MPHYSISCCCSMAIIICSIMCATVDPPKSSMKYRVHCPHYAVVNISFPCKITFDSSSTGSGDLLREGQPAELFTWPYMVQEAVGKLSPDIESSHTCPGNEPIIQKLHFLHSGKIKMIYLNMLEVSDIRILLLHPFCHIQDEYDATTDSCGPKYPLKMVVFQEIRKRKVNRGLSAVDLTEEWNIHPGSRFAFQGGHPRNSNAVFHCDAISSAHISDVIIRRHELKAGDILDIRADTMPTMAKLQFMEFSWGTFTEKTFYTVFHSTGLKSISAKIRPELALNLVVSAAVRIVPLLQPMRLKSTMCILHKPCNLELEPIPSHEIPEVLYTWSIVCESEEFIDTKSGHIFTFTITSAVCFLNASIQPLVGKAQQIEEQVNAFTEFTLDQLNPFYFEKGTIGVINLLGNFPTNGIEFRWHFDDESLPSTTTDTPQISHVYDKVGTFSFKVVASNPAQRQSVTSTVTVYEPLQGLKLSSPSCMEDHCSIVFVYEAGSINSSRLIIDGAVATVSTNITARRLWAHAKSQKGKISHEYAMTAVDYARNVFELTGHVREDAAVKHVEISVRPEWARWGDRVDVEIRVIGGTSGNVYLRNSGSSDILFSSPTGVAMDMHRNCEFKILSEYRHSFCLKVVAAGESKMACVHCNVIPYKLPTMKLSSSSQFKALEGEKMSLSVVNTTGIFIRGQTLRVQWGDGSPITQIENYDPIIVMEHVYSSAGYYNVRAIFSGSPLSPVALEDNVVVFSKIEAMGCRPLENKYFLKLGESATILVFVHASGRFIVDIFGDGLNRNLPTSIHVNGYKQFNITASPNTHGLLTYKVDISNLMTSQSCSVDIIVDIDLPSAEFILKEGFFFSDFEPAKVEGEIVLKHWAVPHAPTCLISAADKDKTAINFPSAADNAVFFEKEITTEGEQILSGTCSYNKGLGEIKPIKIGLFYPLQSAVIRISDADSIESETLGLNKIAFSCTQLLRFEILSYAGTALHAEVIIADEADVGFIELLTIGVSHPRYYKFNHEGKYKVLAVISNPFGRVIYQRQIEIGPAVRGMRLQLSKTVLEVNVPAVLLINFDNVPDSVCICVDLGDGNIIIFLPTDPSIRCPNCVATQENYNRPLNKSLTVNLMYRFVGRYTISVTAGESQNAPIMDAIDVLVEGGTPYCLPPTIEFTDKRISNKDDPLILLPFDKYTVQCRVITRPSNCSTFPDYVWQIQQYDATNNSHKRPIIEEGNLVRFFFFIRANMLPPDNYRLMVIFRNVDELNVSRWYQVAEGFIKVKPLAPVIRLMDTQMSSVAVSREKPDVCLEPAIYSINPNGDPFLSWTITCTEVSATYSRPCSIPDFPSTKGITCFGVKYLQEDIVFKFEAMGTTASIRGTGQIHVSLAVGSIPSISLRFVHPERVLDLGFDPTGTLVSSTNALLLNVSHSGLLQPSARWFVFEVLENGTIHELKKSELGDTVEGWESLVIIFHPALLLRAAQLYTADMTYLRACFANSKNCLQFTPISPPTIIGCTHNATDLISFNSEVCISCNMQASSQPIQYQYLVSSGSERHILTTQYYSEFCGKMPYIPNVFNLCARAIDRLGSFSEYCSSPIQMKLITEEEIKDQIIDFAFGQGANSLDYAISSNPPSDIIPLVHHISSLLLITQNKSMNDSLGEINLRNSKAKILEKLCLAVKDALIIVDSPSMQQAADTLGALSENAYDIPAEGQESIMQIIRTIANGLTAISRVIPESDILQIGKRLSVASLSLLKGLSNQLKNPIPDSVHRKPIEINYETGIDSEDFGSDIDSFEKIKKYDCEIKQRNRSARVSESIQFLNAGIVGVLETTLIGGSFGKQINATTADGSMIHFIRIDSQSESSDIVLSGDDVRTHSSISVPDISDVLGVHGKGIITHNNVYSYGNSRSINIPDDSESATVTFFSNGRPIPIKNTRRPLIVRLSKGEAFSYPPFITGIEGEKELRLPEAMIAVDGSRVQQALVMFSYYVKEMDVAFHWQIHARNSHEACPQYLVYARHAFAPNIQSDSDGHGKEYWAVVPPNTSICGNPQTTADELERNYTFFVNNKQFKEGKTWALWFTRNLQMTSEQKNTFYIGYRQLTQSELDKYTTDNPPHRPYPYEAQINDTVEMRAFESTCNHMNTDGTNWSTDGCLVSRMSTIKMLVCECFSMVDASTQT